ncbi:MAG: hypothetical protein M3271_11670 [Actinomycetota bacterium]|nr:hypothetical protein [Actinomycetota bacterium]
MNEFEGASVRPGSPRRLKRLADYVAHLPRASIVAVGTLLTLTAGLLDYATGPLLAALAFYLVPVALVGWAGERRDGLLVAFVAAGCWALAEALAGRDYASSWVFFWNSATRLVVFLVVASLLHRNRKIDPLGEGSMTGSTCPHCGSADTVTLRLGLVCRTCKRLSEAGEPP